MEKPIKVFWSEMSNRFYASSRYKMVEVSPGKHVAMITGKKFDVTDDIAHAIVKHDLVFQPEKKQVKGRG